MSFVNVGLQRISPDRRALQPFRSRHPSVLPQMPQVPADLEIDLLLLLEQLQEKDLTHGLSTHDEGILMMLASEVSGTFPALPAPVG